MCVCACVCVCVCVPAAYLLRDHGFRRTIEERTDVTCGVIRS
jgi:hypothetical protein